MNYVVYQGDVIPRLQGLPSESVQCVVTSPPYFGLRDYGVVGQFGREKTPAAYVDSLVTVFREVRRVLRDDGVVWLNLGDSYRKKELQGIPWRTAFALQDDGWHLRSDVVWSKPNPKPESVKDRPTQAHEYVFLLTKTKKYFYNADAIREPLSEYYAGPIRRGVVAVRPKTENFSKEKRMRTGTKAASTREARIGFVNPLGKNKRSVWTVTSRPVKGAHFAVFPEKLIEPCILAGSPKDGVVLDPFCGSGTTGIVALRHNRKFVGIELNPDYVKLSRTRIDSSLSSEALF